MKQLFVGSHPNTVRFSDLDSRDRICEIRAMIADAYRMLRDSIGEQAKNETNTFHGPWLVFRNLMNDHPAACLEEFRHASIYFDADTEGKVTEIADLIEQHIELSREALSLKGVHQHQADAMISIQPDTATREVTLRVGLGKTRSNNPHLILADSVRHYIDLASTAASTFEFCVLLTKKLDSDAHDNYGEMTHDEMVDCVHGLILGSSKSIKNLRELIMDSINELSMPYSQFVSGPKFDDEQAADDENFALRG
ncbi:hypothetical protein MPK70_gp287 [Erwinia phage pEa_SNUABM_33]|uniref:Uncharacterized protein n=1 Tax=Erwinia phage pEa_SNUABM_33 TaxID=2869556 RepID=A0AAE7XQ03_9CAUD|nr:hypothetical protein MPK70_gp287 [Erwinia phage pEa_SNUABM_33]QZE58163.1 hypothetical protein pEaSNUABM33_00287 [Erwinia phage pEa_SNUABM_33]